MKVALIQSPVWGTYDPPLALAQLSSFLKSLGHHVFVFDINISFYNRRNQDFKNIWAWEQSGFWYDPLKVSEFFINNHQAINQYVKQIVNTGAQIICFSASSSTWISSLELSRLIKKEKKDALIDGLFSYIDGKTRDTGWLYAEKTEIRDSISVILSFFRDAYISKTDPSGPYFLNPSKAAGIAGRMQDIPVSRIERIMEQLIKLSSYSEANVNPKIIADAILCGINETMKGGRDARA